MQDEKRLSDLKQLRCHFRLEKQGSVELRVVFLHMLTLTDYNHNSHFHFCFSVTAGLRKRRKKRVGIQSIQSLVLQYINHGSLNKQLSQAEYRTSPSLFSEYIHPTKLHLKHNKYKLDCTTPKNEHFSTMIKEVFKAMVPNTDP